MTQLPVLVWNDPCASFLYFVLREILILNKQNRLRHRLYLAAGFVIRVSSCFGLPVATDRVPKRLKLSSSIKAKVINGSLTSATTVVYVYCQ